MFSLAEALTGLVTGFGLIAAIGAQNVFIIRQGVARSHVFLVALTATLCDVALITLGVAGLGTAIAAIPWLASATAIGGALFLLVYGALALRDAIRGKTTTITTNTENKQTARAAVLATLAISLLNPHVYLDTVVLLGGIGGQFDAAGRIAFTAGALVASTVWFFGLAYGARALAPIFQKPATQRILDVIVAAIMFTVALFLLQGVFTGSP